MPITPPRPPPPPLICTALGRPVQAASPTMNQPGCAGWAAMRQVTSAPFDGPTRQPAQIDRHPTRVRPRSVRRDMCPVIQSRVHHGGPDPAFGIPHQFRRFIKPGTKPCGIAVSCDQSRRPRAPGNTKPARKPACPPCRVHDDAGGERSGAGKHANLVLLRQLHPIDRAGLTHLDALLIRIIEQELIERGP